MPLGGRQGGRFEMLINIAVGGAGNLDKLATGAKKAAINMKDVDRTLEDTGVSLEKQNANIERFRTKVDDFVQTRTRLKAAEQKYEQALEQTNSTSAEALARLTNMKAQVDTLGNKTRRLGKEVNELAGKDIIRLNSEVSKSTVSQKRLAQVEEVLTKRQKELGIAIRRAQREAEQQTQEQGQMGAAMDKTTKRVRHQNREWDNFQQRVGHGEGSIRIFRRSLGALRNQILVLTFATAGLRRVLNQAFEAIRAKESALAGLGSVALNTGNKVDTATEAAQRFEKQGLLNITEAAEGLKNLMASGLGLEEAEKMMQALTDAASFNRQGTLALGEAVVGATQGIKNQNSIMVDNAGITKNLSIMYKEFASEIGTTAGKLTEAQKTQAIYNGVLREGALFAGDAAKSLDTVQGALSVFTTETNRARQALGEGLTPAVNILMTNLTDAQQALRAYFEAHRPEVIKTTTSLVESVISMFSLLFGMLNSVKNVMSSLFGGDAASFGQAATWLFKVMIGTRLLNKVVAKQGQGMNALSKTVKGYNVNLMEQFSSTQMVNTITGKSISGLEVLRVRYAAARLAIHKKQVAMARLQAQSTGLNAGFLAVKKTVTGMTASVRAGTMALGGMRGAAIAARTALVGLMKVAARLLAALIVVQGLVMLVQWLTSAGERARKFRQDVEEMNASIDKLEQRLVSVAVAGDRAFRTGFSLGLDTSAITRHVNAIEGMYNHLDSLREKHNNLQDEDERQRVQQQIDRNKERLENRIEALTLEQQTIKNMREDFLEDLSNLNEAYNEAEKARIQALGLESVDAAEQAYADHLRVVEEFNQNREILAEQGPKAAMLQEEKIFQTRKMLNEQRYAELTKISEGFYDKLEKIREKANKGEVKTYDNQLLEIKANFENQRRVARENLQELNSEAIEGLENYVSIFRGRAKEATQAFEIEMERLGRSGALGIFKDAGDKGRITQGATEGQSSLVSSLAQNIAGLNRQYDQGALSLEDYLGRLDSTKQALINTRMAVQGNSQDAAIFKDRLDELISSITTVTVSAKQQMDAEQRLSEVLNLTTERVNAYGEETKQLTQTMIENLNMEEKLALSKEAYSIKMDQITASVRELAMAEEARLEGAAIQTELQMIDIERRRRQGVVALLSPMQKFVELRKENTLALEEERLKIAEVQRQQQSQLTQVEREIKAMEEIASGKVRIGNIDVEMAEEQRQAAVTRLALLYAERDGVLQTMQSYQELAEARINSLIDSNEQAELREQIAAIDRMANAMAGVAMNFGNTMRSVANEHAIYNDRLSEELEAGVITQQQYMQEQLAAQEFFNKKQAYERKMALADLVRTVGREIAAFAARKAAQSGNILAALGMLAGGIAVTMVSNRIASGIENRAERDFARAEREFQRRVDEIRNPGAEDAGVESTRQFGGSIKAEQLQVTISPTIVITGENVFVGSGSVSEFSSEVHDLILRSTQDAIDNRQIDLSTIRSIGG